MFTCFSGILQNNSLDVQFCLSRIKHFRKNIEIDPATFDIIFEVMLKTMEEKSASRSKTTRDARTQHRALHTTVIDSILSEITNRFEDHKRLLFLPLLDPQVFTQYKQSLPENALRSLDESYGAHFDQTRLRTELRMMYSMSDFQGKIPSHLLSFL